MTQHDWEVIQWCYGPIAATVAVLIVTIIIYRQEKRGEGKYKYYPGIKCPKCGHKGCSFNYQHLDTKEIMVKRDVSVPDYSDLYEPVSYPARDEHYFEKRWREKWSEFYVCPACHHTFGSRVNFREYGI
jgi:DNA-directed RNA polymerase subunit M/transcription elongation factor TFIIS